MKSNHEYIYSDKEKGTDGSINPNYYADSNPKSRLMLLDHIENIFPKSWVVGFYVITMIKYLKRFTKKHGLQDLHKVYTYLTHLIHFLERND